ncbi:hypothetical protein [Mesorhizobium sp. M0199]|uniref:hypothetical protein n=1 Tax=Mesorhizobium sp. M0199 TaxID=2956911 RepID=UPI00333C0827
MQTTPLQAQLDFPPAGVIEGSPAPGASEDLDALKWKDFGNNCVDCAPVDPGNVVDPILGPQGSPSTPADPQAPAEMRINQLGGLVLGQLSFSAHLFRTPDPVADRTSVLEGIGAGQARSVLPPTPSPPDLASQQILEGSVASATPDSEVCAAKLLPPFAARQALTNYRDSENYRQCSEASKSLLSAIDDKGPEASSLYNSNYLNDKKFLYNDVKKYADACLNRLNDKEFTGLLTEQQRQTVLNRVGVLSDNTGDFCVGLLYGSGVITAKHCFAELSGAPPWDIKAPSSSLKFTTFANVVFKLSLGVAMQAAHFEPLSTDALDKDYTVLDASPASAGAHFPDSKIQQDRAMERQWQQILLVSVQPYLKATQVNGMAELGIEPSVDVAPTCSILVREGPFLLHGCQTEAGMSGTPMLAIGPDEEVVLVGLHTGETKMLKQPCAKKYVSNFPNYGITLPDLSELMK